MTTSTPTPQPRKRHRLRTFFYFVWGTLGALILTGILAAIFGSSSSSGTTTSVNIAAPSAAPAATPEPTTPAAATPNPDGTYKGSCDYLLGDDPVGGFGPGTARAIGEIDLHNTGNVGVIVQTRITWPQEGAAPITARKTVHLPVGAHKVVRFKVRIDGDQVDLLQSWQERHDFNDGCHYHAAFTDTYGQVQS